MDKIALIPSVAQRLLRLEDEKRALRGAADAKEREQTALLEGVVAGATAEDFDPLAWDLSKIGEGYIAMHAEKTGEPTPLRREVA